MVREDPLNLAFAVAVLIMVSVWGITYVSVQTSNYGFLHVSMYPNGKGYTVVLTTTFTQPVRVWFVSNAGKLGYAVVTSSSPTTVDIPSVPQKLLVLVGKQKKVIEYPFGLSTYFIRLGGG